MAAYDAKLSGGLQPSHENSTDNSKSHGHSHSHSHSGYSYQAYPSPHLSLSGTHPHLHIPNFHLSMPSKPSTTKAESVATYFNGFFQAIIGLSTLGASLTFSYVLSTSSAFSAQPTTPAGNNTSNNDNGPSYFTPNQISQFLALSWLFFILSLALSSILTTVLQFFHDDAVTWWSKGGPHKRVMLWYASTLSTLLTSLLLSAFIFLCLVVTALHPPIGWTALAFTCSLGLASLLSIALRTPLGLVWLSRGLRKLGVGDGEVGGVIDTPGGEEEGEGGGKGRMGKGVRHDGGGRGGLD